MVGWSAVNAGNVGLPPEARCRASSWLVKRIWRMTAVAAPGLCCAMYSWMRLMSVWARGAYRSLTDLTHERPALGLLKAFEHGRPMPLRHRKHIAAGGGDLLQHLGDTGLPVFRQLPHLFDGVFQDLRHGQTILQLAAERELPRARQCHPRCFLKNSVARPQASSAAARSCTDCRCSLTKACSAS